MSITLLEKRSYRNELWEEFYEMVYWKFIFIEAITLKYYPHSEISRLRMDLMKKIVESIQTFVGDIEFGIYFKYQGFVKEIVLHDTHWSKKNKTKVLNGDLYCASF